MSSKTDDPVVQDLPDTSSLPVEKAVKRLIPIVQEVENREYLEQIHVENGYAVSTDGHKLAALPLSSNGEAVDYPVPEIHKTDAIRRQPSASTNESELPALEIVCTHQNDRSGTIKPSQSDDNSDSFPDLEPIWPKTDEDLKVKVNGSYLKRLIEILLEDSEDESICFEFVAVDESTEEEKGINASSPLKITSDQGVAVLMPMLMDE